MKFWGNNIFDKIEKPTKEDVLLRLKSFRDILDTDLDEAMDNIWEDGDLARTASCIINRYIEQNDDEVTKILRQYQLGYDENKDSDFYDNYNKGECYFVIWKNYRYFNDGESFSRNTWNRKMLRLRDTILPKVIELLNKLPPLSISST